MSTPFAQTDDEEAPPKVSNARLIFRLILVAAILVAVVQVMGPYWKRVMTWGLEDNDDAMRILEVRDWLHGQAWFDLTQHRLSPPEGGDMHWSRIADLPLAAMMAPLMALFGPEWGAKYAAFWTPLVLAVGYVVLGARTAVGLGGKGAYIPGIVLLACAPAALSYFLPGRVDHHGIQMMLIAGALWGLFIGGARPAALAGLSIATGICVGLEALPLQIVIIGWVAGRWGLRGYVVKDETIGFGLGFAFGLTILFALTVPAGKWALPVNDAVGRGYVVLGFLGGTLLAGGVAISGKFNLAGRLGGLVAIAVIVLSGIKFFPEIIVPPYGKVDPLLLRLWLNNVNETEPLMTTKLSRLVAFALFPIMAALGAIAAIVMTKDKERDAWCLAALAIIVAAALAIFWQTRVAGLATTVSSIVAAAIAAKAFDRFNWRVALIIVLLVNPLVPGVVGAGIARFIEKKPTDVVTGGGQNCYTDASFATLHKSPTGLVIAPIDMGARVLLATSHSVLAAPYHRNNKGNLAAYQLFMMPQALGKSRAAQMGADYVAICKKSAEVIILSREAPKGLMADLQAGRIPNWLEPLATPKGSDVQAFKVK
jgi:hypothetical protein